MIDGRRTSGFRAFIRAFAHRALRETSGTASVEVVFAIPFLALWFAASFVFFDVFRVSYVNEKAAYTVADLISRREENLDQNYVDGMNRVFDFLIGNRGSTAMRVSGVRYTPAANPADDGVFTIEWSAGTRGVPKYTAADIGDLLDRLPIPKATEMVIVTETFVEYQPNFEIGISQQLFRTFIATQPRFIEQIGFDTEVPSG